MESPIINCPFCTHRIELPGINIEDFEIFVNCSQCEKEFLLGVGVPYITQEQLDNFTLTPEQEKMYKEELDYRRNKNGNE